MENLLDKLNILKNLKIFNNIPEDKLIEKKLTVLYGLLGNIYEVKQLVSLASERKVIEDLQSNDPKKRAFAILTVISEKNEIVDPIENDFQLIEAIDKIENKIAEMISIKSIEADINKKVMGLIETKHQEYLREMKKKVISEEAGAESEFSEKKMKYIEDLEKRPELKTVMEILRPKSIEEIVGQDKAVKALITKLGTPYPQHVILYGPPGVGKTTAARLVLERVKKLGYTPFQEDAPFVEVDGTTLRWDPRDISNPLIGSVHDPIYQGAQKDFAGDGIPEPKLGLVTDAHGGVLFIDEIGEMDIRYQSKLLKVLEDKRVNFESAYYDPENPKIPQFIKKLFRDGAPADFCLIGATTKSPEEINPAIRSRVAEIFFEPLGSDEIKQIIINAAAKLNIEIENDAVELITDYTIEGRKAVNILADVYSTILYDNKMNNRESEIVKINKESVLSVIKTNRLYSYSWKKGEKNKRVGKVYGLGVSSFIGHTIEIEGVKFDAEKGKGSIRFNDTAGSMAKDSIFNAMTVAKKYCGIDIKDFDIHINIVGGGKVDGPSAGAGITSLIISLLKDIPLAQDVAITGEISITGDIKSVGGVVEKIYGAKQAGMRKIVIPEENRAEIPENIKGIEIVTVKRIEDVMVELS